MAMPQITDLSIYAQAINIHEPVEPLNSGFNSLVVKAGKCVLKISKASMPLAKACELSQVMQSECDLLIRYLGCYVLETCFVPADPEGTGQARIMAVQKFVEGPSLDEYLEGTDINDIELLRFLHKSKAMYEGSRKVPDLANIQTGFNVRRNRNVIVNPDTEFPYLVDTSFGKVQRSRGLGPLWSWAIYQGVNRIIGSLDN